METGFSHISILLDSIVRWMQPAPGKVLVDGTLGGGGHSEALLQGLVPGGRLIGIDRDDDALAAAGQRLRPFGEAFLALKGDHKHMPQLLSAAGITIVDGILLDLGVSSWQLNSPDRGFSYNNDGPLDMRMDRSQKLTAYDVVNTYDQKRLMEIIRDYGEDHFASRIASFLVERRKQAPIRTTTELSQVITAAIPAKFRRTGPHPAKRTFQAIRIEVNGELAGLQQTIGSLIDLLGKGGRLCVISFHSLEDRAVKLAMKEAENPCTCPRSAPVCVCGRAPLGKMLTRKPETPGEEEQTQNPRSRSAKLRVFERI